MIFALGALTAGLLALACLPVVSARAMRLTRRRLTQLVPLSMDEIAAERDGLRADFAVDRRRLEQKLEGVEAKRAGVMVELGRRDVRVAALDDEAVVAANRIAALESELRDTTRELYDVRCETGAAAVALHDLTGLAERQRWEVRVAEEAVQSHQATIDENRVAIASLEMRVLGLDDRISDLDRALDNARAELARTEQAVGRATAERDAARAANAALGAERDTAAAEIARLAMLTEDSRHRAASEMQAASAHKATIAELQLDRVTLEARLAMQAEASTASALRVAEVEAGRARLAGELADPSIAGGSSGDDAELAALRKALRQVADDVLRMIERNGAPPEAAAPSSATLSPSAELSLPN